MITIENSSLGYQIGYDIPLFITTWQFKQNITEYK